MKKYSGACIENDFEYIKNNISSVNISYVLILLYHTYYYFRKKNTNHMNILKWLIDNGANINCHYDGKLDGVEWHFFGFTPLHMACYVNCAHKLSYCVSKFELDEIYKIAKILLNNKVDFFYKNINNKTALELLYESGHLYPEIENMIEMIETHHEKTK
jgi:hypothetical protein